MNNRPTLKRPVTPALLPGQRLAQLARSSPELARALPSSRDGESPRQLQMYRTEIYSWTSRANGETEHMYSADRFVKMQLSLEDGGPIAFGTSANLGAVASGAGRQLNANNRSFEAVLCKGTNIYVVSSVASRIGVTIEPIPWLAQISAELVAVLAVAERQDATLQEMLQLLKGR